MLQELLLEGACCSVLFSFFYVQLPVRQGSKPALSGAYSLFAGHRAAGTLVVRDQRVSTTAADQIQTFKSIVGAEIMKLRQQLVKQPFVGNGQYF